MSLSKQHWEKRFPLLFLVVFGTGLLRAQNPTTWWPDPATGLMWTGQVATGNGHGMNWQQAKDYCTSLQLGGYSVWRLPTADEMKAITYSMHVVPAERHYPPYDSPSLKGGINGTEPGGTWTMTLLPNKEAWTVAFWNGHGMSLASALNSVLLTEPLDTLCTRAMERDLMQIAKDAQVNWPVTDLPTLKAYIPLNKAKTAYQAGQFQESITQAQNALAIKPNFAFAEWALGISYGRLAQWDQAVSTLKAALKMDKNYDAAKNALKWANEGQKAAKSGKNVKAPIPQWN